MFDLIKAISIVENKICMYRADSEAQPYRDNAGEIAALESVLNDLNNELHAQMLVMDQFAKEIEDGNENRTEV